MKALFEVIKLNQDVVTTSPEIGGGDEGGNCETMGGAGDLE